MTKSDEIKYAQYLRNQKQNKRNEACMKFKGSFIYFLIEGAVFFTILSALPTAFSYL